MIIWAGIFLVHITRKKNQIELNDTSATSSDDFNTPTTNNTASPLSAKEKRTLFVYDGDKNLKSSNSNLHIESVNRIFGASKTSFR